MSVISQIDLFVSAPVFCPSAHIKPPKTKRETFSFLCWCFSVDGSLGGKDHRNILVWMHVVPKNDLFRLSQLREDVVSGHFGGFKFSPRVILGELVPLFPFSQNSSSSLIYIILSQYNWTCTQSPVKATSNRFHYCDNTGADAHVHKSTLSP